MSRAILISVRIVSGFRFFTSRPQASPVWIRAAPEMTSAAEPARNFRRSSVSPSCDDRMGFLQVCSAIASVLLQHLDLVAVRVLHEEEARHQRAVAEEFLDRIRLEAFALEARMLGRKVVDRDRNVPVA